MRRVKKLVTSLLVSLFVLFFCVAVLLQTSDIRKLAKEFLIEIIENKTGFKVAIEELRISPSFRISAKNVSLSDETGKEIDIGGVSIEFFPLALWNKSIHLTALITPNNQSEQWIAAELTYDDGRGAVQLDHSGGTHFEGEYFLNENKTIHLTHLHASHGPISVDGYITASFTGESVDASLLITTGNLSEKFLIDGQISGQGKISGSLWAPEIKVNLYSDRLSYGDNIFDAVEASIESFKSGEKLQGNITLSFKKDKEPHRFSGNILWDDTLGPMPAQITAKTSLEEIADLCAFDSSDVSGEVSLSLEFSKNGVAGKALIENGRIESYTFGSVFSGIQAECEGNLERLTLKQLSANDGDKGSYTGQGTVQFIKGKSPILDLVFTLENSALIQLDSLKAAGNGSVKIVGTLDHPIIEGTLTTTFARYEITEATSEIKNMIDVAYINQSTEEAPPTIYTKKKPRLPIELNIRLIIPKNLSIKGGEFNSAWKGEGVISGTSHSPLFNGELSLIKGTYRIRGKQIKWNEGTISFAGDLGKKATLYLIGSVNADKYSMEMIVKGPAGNPSVSFRSNPPLPQREILSWILFNKGSSEISQFEGTQLSQSVRALSSGSSRGPDILTRIGNTIGIDRIDITSNSEDVRDVTLEIGKYLTETTYISISQSLSGDSTNEGDSKRVCLQKDLGKQFKLEAEIDDDHNGQLNLLWKKDY